jgi:hypothetical protein
MGMFDRLALNRYKNLARFFGGARADPVKKKINLVTGLMNT